VRLLADLETLYEGAIPNFVRKNFFSPADFFGLKQLRLVAKHKMLGNLARRIESYVQDPRLRMLFSFQTMYLGLSPFRAPWVYAVLTHMEYGEGIWYPQGGVSEIGRAIAKLARARGAEIRLNSEVANVEGRRVTMASGETIEADAVILNADLPYAKRELLGEPPVKASYSCSAYMEYIDYQGELPELLHHNVFFGPDFRANLDQIFTRLELPDEPAFYAAISARTDSSRAKPGHENLYLLTPCPNLDRTWTAHDALALRDRVYRRLAAETSFDPARIAAVKSITPVDWAEDLNLDKGAAFGLTHEFKQSAYFRPSNRSRTHDNTYFVGASTVPGNGLPMVLISAELLEQRLERDQLITTRQR